MAKVKSNVRTNNEFVNNPSQKRKFETRWIQLHSSLEENGFSRLSWRERGQSLRHPHWSTPQEDGVGIGLIEGGEAGFEKYLQETSVWCCKRQRYVRLFILILKRGETVWKNWRGNLSFGHGIYLREIKTKPCSLCISGTYAATWLRTSSGSKAPPALPASFPAVHAWPLQQEYSASQSLYGLSRAQSRWSPPVEAEM